MQLSLIIPAVNEAECLPALLARLHRLRQQGHEILLVDGGSEDATREVAAGSCDRVLTAARGRAAQMNEGARHAGGEVLWFVHADTLPPEDAVAGIEAALSDPGVGWGRFDVRLSGRGPALRVIERMMNWRSRWSGIATGDQAIFVRRSWFVGVGGFPAIDLMEDVALSTRLRRLGRPACLRQRVTTSSRRWERDGVLRTIVLMWRLRLAYALGADPRVLARRYGHG